MAFDKAEFPLQSKGKTVVAHSDAEGAKHLPNGTQAATGDVVTMGADRKAKWSPVSGVSVSSVFGRTGAVTAQTGDYTAAQVGALPASGGSANYFPKWGDATSLLLSSLSESDDGTVSSPNQFTSGGGFGVYRSASDTRFLGPWIELSSSATSPTKGNVLQLNNSGGLSNWQVISSAWILKRVFATNGYTEIGGGSNTALSGANIRLADSDSSPSDGWMFQPMADHRLGFWPRYAGSWHSPVLTLDYGGVLTLPALAGGSPIEPIGVDSAGSIIKLGGAQSFGTASASFTYSTSTPKMVRTNGVITVTLPAASGFAGYETTFFQEQVAGGSVTFTGPFEGYQLGVWTHHAGSWGWSIGYPKLTLSCDGLTWYVVAA